MSRSSSIHPSVDKGIEAGANPAGMGHVRARLGEPGLAACELSPARIDAIATPAAEATGLLKA